MLSDKEALEALRLLDEDQPRPGVLEAVKRQSDRAEPGSWQAVLSQVAKQELIVRGFWGRFSTLDKLLGKGLFILCLLAGLTGFLAALQAFGANLEGVVNFFWLLAILLGLNWLSLLIWFLAAALRPLAAGATQPHWLHGLLTQASTIRPGKTDVLRIWLLLRGKRARGFWRFGLASHTLWLSYLLGGLLMVLLMLSTRQFSFIWETTLLSEDRFQALTHWLGQAVSALGIVPPNEQAVRISQPGTPLAQLAVHREAWAWLLLGSLLVLGLLPRLILASFCAWRIRVTDHRYHPDSSLPYLIQLRQALHPPVSHRGVIDPDKPPENNAPKETDHPLSPGTPFAGSTGTLWVGLEVQPPLPWPPTDIHADYCLGNLTDRESRAIILSRLKTTTFSRLVVMADVRRAADRGLQARLSELIASHRGETQLLLLQLPELADDDALQRQRLSDWYRLAYACGLEDRQIRPQIVIPEGL